MMTTRYEAAVLRQVEANHADTLQTSVPQTLMNMELQIMVALQTRLDLGSELTRLSKTAKEKMDLLFRWIVDSSTSRIKSISQLVLALEKTSNRLQFGEEIREASLSAVVLFLPLEGEEDGMARATYESFVQDVVARLKNTTLDDFAKFVVYQVFFTGGMAVAAKLEQSSPHQDITPLVVEEEASSSASPTIISESKEAVVVEAMGGETEIQNHKSILNDERMQALFVLFDTDVDSTEVFKGVAIGLYPLTKNMGGQHWIYITTMHGTS